MVKVVQKQCYLRSSLCLKDEKDVVQRYRRLKVNRNGSSFGNPRLSVLKGFVRVFPSNRLISDLNYLIRTPNSSEFRLNYYNVQGSR